MVVHTRRMTQTFTEKENLMDIEIRVMEKKIEGKVKECLKEPPLSMREKDIMILSVGRKRAVGKQHWWKKTQPNQLINQKMENCW